MPIDVSAGNGMAGHTMPHVLGGLPGLLEKMYFTDGTPAHHEANPREITSVVQAGES
ncbi:hypothetical protein [Streptomyces piniterrae]|uniref:hypothetical protein n=1 Tax=Streptomyces piniterrae TaxID=2571125 RepID=UPI00145F34AC|nr:hypothetical protein [Streptomyces piniterrae]